jgi:hypothetical protein
MQLEKRPTFARFCPNPDLARTSKLDPNLLQRKAVAHQRRLDTSSQGDGLLQEQKTER